MKKIRVIIADDEAPARNKMMRMLGKMENVEIVHIAENGLEALESIETHKPDIVFLDIEMPGLTGIEVAQNLNPGLMPYVVFATAYNEHAIKAFELNAVDYLLKPFNEDRLRKTLEKITADPKGQLLKDQPDKIESLAQDEDSGLPFSGKIPIPIHDRFQLIGLEEVVLIEVTNRTTFLFTMDKSYTLTYPLDYYEKKFPDKNFLRINRSSMIGLNHIDEILIWFGNRFKIKLNNGKEVICSREKSKILKQVLKF